MNVWTLTNLPTGGHVTAWITADRRTPESDEFGVPEESGWIDPRYSRTEIFASRNDVTPLSSHPVEHILDGIDYGNGVRDEPSDIVTDICSDIRGWVGFADSVDDGTIYGTAQDFDPLTPDVYAYAVHVQVKYRAANGEWVEEPVRIDIADINA